MNLWIYTIKIWKLQLNLKRGGFLFMEKQKMSIPHDIYLLHSFYKRIRDVVMSPLRTNKEQDSIGVGLGQTLWIRGEVSGNSLFPTLVSEWEWYLLSETKMGQKKSDKEKSTTDWKLAQKSDVQNTDIYKIFGHLLWGNIFQFVLKSNIWKMQNFLEWQNVVEKLFLI